VLNGTIDMLLAEKIKEAMMLAGIKSERELAELSGVSYGTVHNYIMGRREPSFFKLMKIAKACGKEINYFADADEVTGKPPKKGK
jgi:transcriptional regulator with XRE-family HTH domain